jgi:hypothetical protein
MEITHSVPGYIWSLNPAGGVAAGYKLTDAKINVLRSYSNLTASLYDPFAPKSDKAITSFMLAGAEGTIDEGSGTIEVAVPYGTDITALTPEITHTGQGISPNATNVQDFSGPVTYTVTAADLTTKTYTVLVTIAPLTASSVSISPSHAILANPADKALFKVVLKPDGGYGDVVWSLEDGSSGPLAASNYSLSSDNKTLEILATAAALDLTRKRTLLVKAVYDGKYEATATIEVLPGGVVTGQPVPSDNATVKLLETKATVNKAKTRGTLVPILITHQEAGSFGLKALAEPPGWTGSPSPDTGTMVIDGVGLVKRERDLRIFFDNSQADNPGLNLVGRAQGPDLHHHT